MVDRLLNIVLFGGEPILYVLMALSGVSIALVIERFVVYLKNRIDVPSFTVRIVGLLNEGDRAGAIAEAALSTSAEAQVVADGLVNLERGPRVVEELMDAAAMRQQQRFDRRLPILGTIGSNAPFVGLLGTVLGIIKAFHDLSMNAAGGASVVMAGIAEALIATAVGLVVAIPAVVFFNYFKNRQKQIMSNIAQLQKTLLAFAGDDHREGEPGRERHTQRAA